MFQPSSAGFSGFSGAIDAATEHDFALAFRERLSIQEICRGAGLSRTTSPAKRAPLNSTFWRLAVSVTYFRQFREGSQQVSPRAPSSPV
jgi:hypothetical protein